MVININAGHNPDGKIACGAVGILKESTEARAIASLVISKLRKAGHTAIDCTINDGQNANDILKRATSKCNMNKVDLNLFIHLNAGSSDADQQTTGTEAYIFPASSAKKYAEALVKSIEELGFKNRGVKDKTNLYVLKHTSDPAVLLECFFVDDKDDCALYNAEDMSDAIVVALTNCLPAASKSDAKTQNIEQPKQVPVHTPKPHPVKTYEGIKVVYDADVVHIQKCLNKYYSAGLKVDGLYGQKTDTALAKVIVGEKTKNSMPDLTAFIQNMVKASPDGWFGRKTKEALIRWQDANGLKADGIAGRLTLRAMLKEVVG